MAERDDRETEVVINTSDLCLDCGADIANREATSYCAVCERALLSHLNGDDEETETENGTTETDTLSKRK